MATLSSAAVFYESGQSSVAFAAMTDAGAHTVYTTTTKPWSQVSGYEYVVAPYGLATGGVITPGASAQKLNIAAATAYMAGVATASATTGLLTVNASTDTVTCTRGADANAYIINSITIDSAGAYAAVAGTATTAFSPTRGGAGGPPSIPLASVEIGQVRLTSTTPGVITSGEIFQVVGTHQERYDYPVWAENPLEGSVTFASALPVIHGGTAGAAASATKLVYLKAATPIFAEISRARDWVPAETSNSVNSEQYYDSTVGSYSSSLGQASFTASLNDGVTDALLAKKGANLLFKFMPDKNKVPYQLTQGVLGVSRTFVAGANPTASFTVSASLASVDFAA